MSITILSLGCNFQCSQRLDFFPSAFRILLESDEDRLLVVFNRGLILMTEVITLLFNYSKHLTLRLPLSALIRFLFSTKKIRKLFVFFSGQREKSHLQIMLRGINLCLFGVIPFITGS